MELGRPFATVTPTLDGDVLTVLAECDGIFTTGQVHRILGRYSEEGIRKVLRRLTAQGVVRAEQIGQAFAYRLNREHLAAEHIIGLARLRETFLKRVEERCREWRVPPVYAAIFGSMASRSTTVGSDVDLLLVRIDDVEPNLWARQVSELVTDMTAWSGNDTRALEYTFSEIIARGTDEPVLADVLNEGLTVCGSRSWLAEQLRRGNR